MEIKKNPKVDVNNKRTVLLEIGLILALLIVIAAFLYSPKEVTVEKIDMNYGPVEEQITEITRQEEQKPEPPKKTEITVITDVLNIVTNDEKIETGFDFAEFDEDVTSISSWSKSNLSPFLLNTRKTNLPLSSEPSISPFVPQI